MNPLSRTTMACDTLSVSSELEAQQIATTLYNMLFVTPPKRCATMCLNGDRKYSDAPKNHRFSIEDLRDHLRGDEQRGGRTWATTLADKNGMALAGVRDYDSGGKEVLVDALASAAKNNVTAFAIHMPGSGIDADHDGGHVWVFYSKPVPAKDIRSQLCNFTPGKGEIYPSGNAVRLPLGFHRRKGTRGTLILQDSREFYLDQPHQFVSGLRAILALRLNAAPPEATTSISVSGGSFGDAYDVQAWQGRSKANGELLMASGRYKYLFSKYEQLAKLSCGERVVLPREGGLDDSGSVQVAVLVWNLIRAKREGRALGDGAPPESEIRDIALYWKDMLRDNRSDEHYRAHVDYEITKYRPTTYRPESTLSIATTLAARPTAFSTPKTRGRGRPIGSQGTQRLARLDILCDLLIEGTDVQRIDLARATSVSTRQIGNDLHTLQSTGRVELKRTRYGYHVVRVEEKISSIQNGNYVAFDPLQCDPSCLGETPRAVCSSDVEIVIDETDANDAQSNVGSLSNDASCEPIEQFVVRDNSQDSNPPASVSPVVATSQSSPLVLSQAVVIAIDAIPERYKTTNRKTGEIRSGVITKSRVRALVRELGGNWSNAAIDRALLVERKRRSWNNSIFAKEHAAAVKATTSQVRKRARTTAQIYAQYAKKQHPKSEYSRIIAGIWATEENRRDTLNEAESNYLINFSIDAPDAQYTSKDMESNNLFRRSVRELAHMASVQFEQRTSQISKFPT